jgi:flagellar hook-associated protein 3 FlgL
VRTSFISSLSLFTTPRTGILRMQADMAQLSKEVATGRMADAGLNLGAESGRAVTLHVDTAALAALIDSNGSVAARLQQSQSTLDQMRTGGDDFLQQLIASRDTNAPVQSLGASGLAGFTDLANATDGRNYLFAGINTAIQPIADYSAGPQAAVDAAFLAKFGVTQSDPLASGIAAADMKDFLDNEFSALFADPNWGTTWSSAADQPVANRISPTETLDTSVSANQPAMRKLAMVYSMVAGLGTDNLGDAARKAVLDKAIDVLGSALTGVTDLQQTLGAAQNRVTDTTSRLTLQQDVITTRIGVLEGVDPAEAKVKIDTLSTQIEMSYSLTVKLLQMSILNYA